MGSFTKKDIADYYDQTINHYRQWWHLDQSLAVHYGFWDEKTSSFKDALKNTNRYLMRMADVQKGERILDAGCGVGGSAFYLASERDAKVTGISLSRRQIDFANNKAKELNLEKQVDFELKDYTKTNYDSSSFDLVWAIESITSAPEKSKFAAEANRILKPGGRVVIADYFRCNGNKVDSSGLLEKWRKNWSMAPFLTLEDYTDIFQANGLSLVKQNDVTGLITKTSRMMYRNSILGAIPSVTYNLFHNTSRFAKHHYKSGFYQYKALKKKLWEYRVVLFQKPD